MNWINIKDSQPEERQTIVCASLPKDGSELWVSIGRASYDPENNKWSCWYNNEYEYDIDYWLPIEDLTRTIPK